MAHVDHPLYLGHTNRVMLARQVDNGTGDFGSEITLRGLFEAGSVGSAAGPPLEKLVQINSADDTFLGWEGAVRSKPSVAQAEGAEADSGLVICLCFEGGPGTIGTVKVRADAASIVLALPPLERAAVLLICSISWPRH
jgi:hypothetical protein